MNRRLSIILPTDRGGSNRWFSFQLHLSRYCYQPLSGFTPEFCPR